MRASHAVGDDQQPRCRRTAPGSAPCRSGAGGRPSRSWRSRPPAFFSSITASGRPLTNSTTSGRRLCWPSIDGELVDRQPVVVLGLVEVDHPRLRAGDRAVRPAVLDRHAVHQQPVHRAVVRHQRRPVGVGELAERLLPRRRRQPRIQPLQRRLQPSPQQHLVRRRPFGQRFAGCDIRPKYDVVP